MRPLQETLLHAAVFSPLALGCYWLFADHGASPEHIVIGGAEVQSIRSHFREIWSRYPTDAELGRLVESVARDEILARESKTLGVSRDGPDVAERIQQKYQALADARLALRTPTDEELADWLQMHAADYAAPATVTYSQILLVAAGTAGDAERKARRAQIRLNYGARPARVGVKSPLPAKAWRVSIDEVANEYGASFAETLARLPQGVWQGPVMSRYGAHLVRVESLMPGAVPPLDDVRNAVTRDYDEARRQRALEVTLEAARQKYEVIVEPALARQASRS
jgi:parvulin-like peptidyl-prolyl isomerase